MGCVAWNRGVSKEIYYQDVWFEGKPLIRGARECEFRYHAIKKFLKKLKRPIKVLDIGANMGYFSMRLREDFKGCFVMVEGAPHIANGLLKLCKLNRPDNVILLKKCLNLDDLLYFVREEHFDVVLALSIIHHFTEPYNDVLKVMMQLGSYVILEPPIKEEVTLNQSRIIAEPLDLTPYPHQELVRVPQGSASKSSLYRKTYVFPRSLQSGPCVLKHSTFVHMNGIFPLPDEETGIILKEI